MSALSEKTKKDIREFMEKNFQPIGSSVPDYAIAVAQEEFHLRELRTVGVMVHLKRIRTTLEYFGLWKEEYQYKLEW